MYTHQFPQDCEKLKSEKYLALEDERELHQKEVCCLWLNMTRHSMYCSLNSVLPSSSYQLEKQRQASEHALLELQSQLQVLS